MPAVVIKVMRQIGGSFSGGICTGERCLGKKRERWSSDDVQIKKTLLLLGGVCDGEKVSQRREECTKPNNFGMSQKNKTRQIKKEKRKKQKDTSSRCLQCKWGWKKKQQQKEEEGNESKSFSRRGEKWIENWKIAGSTQHKKFKMLHLHWFTQWRVENRKKSCPIVQREFTIHRVEIHSFSNASSQHSQFTFKLA